MDDTTVLHHVIADCEDHYVVWPLTRPVLPGWHSINTVGTIEECRAYIRRVDDERRPDVLRRLVENGTMSP